MEKDYTGFQTVLQRFRDKFEAFIEHDDAIPPAEREQWQLWCIYKKSSVEFKHAETGKIRELSFNEGEDEKELGYVDTYLFRKFVEEIVTAQGFRGYSQLTKLKDGTYRAMFEGNPDAFDAYVLKIARLYDKKMDEHAEVQDLQEAYEIAHDVFRKILTAKNDKLPFSETEREIIADLDDNALKRYVFDRFDELDEETKQKLVNVFRAGQDGYVNIVVWNRREQDAAPIEMSAPEEFFKALPAKEVRVAPAELRNYLEDRLHQLEEQASTPEQKRKMQVFRARIEEPELNIDQIGKRFGMMTGANNILQDVLQQLKHLRPHTQNDDKRLMEYRWLATLYSNQLLGNSQKVIGTALGVTDHPVSQHVKAGEKLLRNRKFDPDRYPNLAKLRDDMLSREAPQAQR